MASVELDLELRNDADLVLRDSKGRMVFSPSQLKTWMGCQLQGKYHYVDMIPDDSAHIKAVFGTCVHEALDWYERGSSVEEASSRFLLTWETPTLITSEPNKFSARGLTYAGLRQKGVEIIEEHHEKINTTHDRQLVGSEIPFMLPFGSHIIRGHIDLIDIMPNMKGVPTLRVIDHKSSSRRPTKIQLALDIQFTSYLYAVQQKQFWDDFSPELWETVKDMPKVGIWNHLMTGDEIDAGKRGEADFNRMLRLADSIKLSVDREVYVPTIDHEVCGFCAYKEQCTSVQGLLEVFDDEYPIGDDGLDF